MSDLADAIRLRDATLPVIHALGRPPEFPIFEGVATLVLPVGEALLVLIGPFKLSAPWSWPEPATASLPGPVFHRLGVTNPGPQLVLDWAGNEVAPHHFTRGPWEDALIASLPAPFSIPTTHEVSNG